MSMIIGGRRFDVPGVEVISWLDNPSVPETIRNTQPRRQRIQLITLHATSGRPTGVLPGFGTSRGFYWAHDSAFNSGRVSWDATALLDGRVLWQNDPARRFTWHGNAPNDK